jgi:hypothetical protein
MSLHRHLPSAASRISIHSSAIIASILYIEPRSGHTSTAAFVATVLLPVLGAQTQYGDA